MLSHLSIPYRGKLRCHSMKRWSRRTRLQEKKEYPQQPEGHLSDQSYLLECSNGKRLERRKNTCLCIIHGRTHHLRRRKFLTLRDSKKRLRSRWTPRKLLRDQLKVSPFILNLINVCTRKVLRTLPITKQS